MKNTLLLFLFCLLFSSCQKEQEGCTDVSAINYEAAAEIENGTCKYCNTYDSPIFALVLQREDPNDYLLDVQGLGDLKMEQGCELVIDLSGLGGLPSTEIQWSPAEFFDCSTCSKVTLQPQESIELILKINSPEGYYFGGSFNVSVLD